MSQKPHGFALLVALAFLSLPAAGGEAKTTKSRPSV